MTSTSDELQELLKQDILQSVSIADELACRATEIERLREELLSRDNKLRHQAEEIERLHHELDAASLEVQRLERIWETSTQKEIEHLRQQVTQRGARMQIMLGWLQRDPAGLWYAFCRDIPDATLWFDADGVPK